MAALVDMASGEVGQAGGAGVKPAPGPKPRLTPKPFSLQRNTTLRTILAPKTLTTTPQPSQTTPTTSSKPEPNQPISAPVSDSSSAVKLDAESTMTPEPTKALKALSAITPQTDSTQTTEHNKAALSTSSSITAPISEPPASTISDPTGTLEENQVSESELDKHGDSDTGHSATRTESVTSSLVTPSTPAPLQPQSEDTVSEPTSAVVRRHAGEDQAAHCGGGRKRLSMELTSRFVSAGLLLFSQPPAKHNNQNQEQATKRATAVLKVSVLRTTEEEKIIDSPGSDPECRLKHSALLKEERDGEGVKEEGEDKVSSIQRRISLLLNSSSRPEALTKRKEVPGPIKQADGSGGVKQQIKDWVLDTPPVQVSNQRVDVAPQPIPVRVHPALSVTVGLLATSESVRLAPREDKASILRSSGHSGIKVNREETDDEEEEGEEEEGEEEGAHVPLYKPAGRLLWMEDGGKKQELVIDEIEKDMKTKVQEGEKRQQLELEERQAEKEREKEEERKRQREGRERQREIERERERQKQREEEERERKIKEEEKKRERQIELEREKERLRKEEERERRIEDERVTERQIEVKRERERQREEEERKMKEERDRERRVEIERERERQRQREEEERERIRVVEERLREKEREKLIEEEREREIKREEERMKEDERQGEEERARERQREEEREKEEAESPVQLITLEPDQPPKPEPPSLSPTIPIIEPITKDEEQPHIKVVYNFSIKEEKPLIEVAYDNFSVKLGRYGSQARLLADRAQVETPSPGRSLGPSDTDIQRTVVNTQEPLHVKPHPAERDIEWGVPTPENGMEKEDEEEEENMDTEEEQLKCRVGAGEGHDTEALVGGEPDKQYGGCDIKLSEDDSPKTTVDQISPVTPDEPNSTSPLEETEEPLAFPDISPPLLDTSAQRARAELRKSRRTRPPRAIRQNSTTATLEEDRVHDWRFCDSSDKVDSLTRGDCESDEEQPRGREVCSPPSQPQRIPLFSGMDPSSLKSQLKKRNGGGGNGADRQTDRLALSPSQLSRSPGCSSFLPGASQVLPPVGNKDGGEDSSPSWLQELKSKKRLSQYNSED